MPHDATFNVRMTATASEVASGKAGLGTASVPSIAVCIATHNRPHYVRSCLESLGQQSIGTDAFDIIVVDSCGTPEIHDRLAGMIAALPNARLLRADRPGASAARNLGARQSRADFIAFIDDDALAAPDWLARMREVIAEHDPWPGVVG